MDSRDNTRLILDGFDDVKAGATGDTTYLRVGFSEHALRNFRNSMTTQTWGKSVLVLGATGFVGVHLVRALLENRHVEKVWTIVRRRNAASPVSRLNEAGNAYDLAAFDEQDLERLVCIEGNVLSPRFGLSEELYEKLCADVDTVLQVSGDPNYLVPYETQRVWVDQLLHILDFCAHGRAKQLTYMGSTIARLYESPKDFSRSDSFWHCGYSLMKWVNQSILAGLVETGLRVSVCEAPYVLASTQGGKDPGMRYALWRGLRAARRMGMMYDGPGPSYAPIDVLCRMIIQNALHRNVLGFLRPSNPIPYDNRLIADLMGCKIVPWSEFHGALMRRSRNEAQKIYPEDLPRIVASSNGAPCYPEGFEAGLFPPTEALMPMYLRKVRLTKA